MSEDITTEDFMRIQTEYWRQVRESDGFDIENISLPNLNGRIITGLLKYDCQRSKNYPYKILIKNCASLGLHRYNLLKGTNFEFQALFKFNMLQNAVSSFYITLLAQDQSSSSREPEIFQVRIDEQRYGALDLACSIARLKNEVTTTKSFVPHFHGGAVAKGIFKSELPDWPSTDALNDVNRFYLLKESEWDGTNWVYMYLELVICTHDRSIVDLRQQTNPLENLKIMKVAIETGTDDVEPLKAKSANVYITFRGLEEARAPRRKFESGKHVERKAIVRRVIDEDTGYLSLVGKLCGGEYVPPSRPRPGGEEKRTRLG